MRVGMVLITSRASERVALKIQNNRRKVRVYRLSIALFRFCVFLRVIETKLAIL